MASTTIRIHYAPARGRIALRTSMDWDRDVEPVQVSTDRTVYQFDVELRRSFAYYKPVQYIDGRRFWSMGHNYLALADAATGYDIYPYFRESGTCSVCELQQLIATDSGESYQYRVFHPPGYDENQIKRYPVLYMQDGQNLFFPNEAFNGAHWRIAETVDLLNQMNLIDKVIVVGIYPNERMSDYTKPGYESYARFLVDVLKPAIDAEYRTLPERSKTSVMGSSLGGVVSFYLAWQYPEVFGGAACLSSAFGYRDDLLDRVADEGRKPLRIYLDTGWPNDNFEVTRSMRTLLVQNGFEEGRDLMYLAFPDGRHNEASWATRCHIPLQFLFGKRPLSTEK